MESYHLGLSDCHSCSVQLAMVAQSIVRCVLGMRMPDGVPLAVISTVSLLHRPKSFPQLHLRLEIGTLEQWMNSRLKEGG